jgi:hypothetical protein
LTAVISVEAAGESRDKLRAVVAKSLDLANSLQHRKEPSDVEAMICADATIFVAAAIRRLTRAEGSLGKQFRPRGEQRTARVSPTTRPLLAPDAASRPMV